MNNGIINFRTGLTTPKIDCRSDIEKYSGGCRILSNMIIKPYGVVERRTGTEYIVTSTGDGVYE